MSALSSPPSDGGSEVDQRFMASLLLSHLQLCIIKGSFPLLGSTVVCLMFWVIVFTWEQTGDEFYDQIKGSLRGTDLEIMT